MDRFNWVGIKFLAGVTAIFFLTPAMLHAEYNSNYYSRGGVNAGKISQDIGKVQAGLSEKKSSDSDSSKSLAEQTKENLKKVEESLTLNAQERELRAKNGKWRETLDKLKVANSLPAIFDANIAKRRAEQAKGLKNLFAQMPTAASQINAGDLNVQGLESSCRDGVDFGQFKTLNEQMSTQPFQFLRQHGSEILKEQDKERKKEKLATLQKLASQFDKLAQKDNFDDPKVSVLDQDNSLESRLIGLEDTGNKLKQGIRDQRKNLVKSLFSDFIPKLSQIEENDEQMLQLGAMFADNLEQFRKASLDTAVINAQKLRDNCEKIAERVGRDNPLAPNTLLNSAYQWLVHFHKGDADYFANPQFLQGAMNMSRNMNCTDVTAQVDGLFGGNLQQQIAAIRQAQDPQTLLTGAMNALAAIGNSQAQVGSMIRPLMDDCDSAAKNEKQVKDYVAQLQTQVSQQAQKESQAGGRSRLQGGRSSSAAGQGGRSNPLTHRAGGLGR